MKTSSNPRAGSTNRRNLLTLLLATLAVLAAVLVPTPGPAAAGPPGGGLESEKMSLTSGAGAAIADGTASGGAAMLVWSNGTATGTLDVRKAAPALAVTARADRCEGGAEMRVEVDGRFLALVTVDSTSWATYNLAVPLSKGRHQVSLAFANDHLTSSCDRNLVLDVVNTSSSTTTSTTTTSTTTTSTTSTTAAPTTTTTTTVPTDTTSDPLVGETLHVSWSAATGAADAIRDTNPEDAARLDLLARTPTARWFGEWSGNISIAADAYVHEATAAGALPVLVAYMIPGRDCGLYSSGGAASADAYRTWIRDLAAGIGSREAVVIVEPDAVALADCMGEAGAVERYALLADAVDVLAANPATTVYLDGGNAGWLHVDDIAWRLTQAGVDDARGVSLNVSNFGTTEDQVTYAAALKDRIGVHAVIDTSRNGNGSDGNWCNPFGRAIGELPTTDPALPSVIDAVLWIKVPGESDGTCNDGPEAGTFWPEYAIDLVRSAGY